MSHYRRVMLRRILATVLALICVLGVMHVGRATLPKLRGFDVVSSQVGWLSHTAPRAASEMQALFPEGEFFTWALTGLAAGNLARAGHDVQAHLEVLERAIQATGQPAVANRFGHNEPLPHGVFYHGWRLLLLVDRAALTRDPSHVTEMNSEAMAIIQALEEKLFPTSYPGQAWPCDAVVALAAVHRAEALQPIENLDEVTERWFDATTQHRDPVTGLLVHQLGQDGSRGSSQSIIQTFLPDIDPERAAVEWERYKQHFLASPLGLVGVREYPHGHDGAGDVDSGPLISGVSASASAVTLAAARRHGDLSLATVLDREADLLGIPLPIGHGSAMFLGAVPVGDAFVAWARSTPAADDLGEPAPQPWWWLMWVTALLPGLLAFLLWRSARHA